MNEGFYVYLLYQDTRIVYVGSSTDLYVRLLNHTKQKRFNRVKFASLHTQESMLQLEQYYISRYKPMYNTLGISVDADSLVGVYHPVWQDIDEHLLRELIAEQGYQHTEMVFDGVFIPKDFLSAKEFKVNEDLVRLTLTDKLVYLYLRLHFENGDGIPTYPQIATQLGCDSKTISRSVTTLRNNKLIDTAYGVGFKLLLKNVVDIVNNP